jgi:two-component system cell cycle response regulator
MKILVADDDFITSLALVRNLQDWGYDVSVARNGLEAWEKLKPGDIRLAVLDWMMPGLTGVQVAQKVRQDILDNGSKYIYIILLSGSDGYEDIVNGLSAGADDYITKPYGVGELKIRLQQAERKIKMEDERRKLNSFDELTKLWNLATLKEFLDEEIARAAREKKPTGLILLSLDSLDDIEKNFGRSVAEQVLVEAGRRLKKIIRRYDKVGRFGRQEFLVILPGCGLVSTERIAGRLVLSMKRCPVISDAGLISLSLSSGTVSTESLADPSTKTLFQACESALSASRNREMFPAAAVPPHPQNPR